MYAYYEKKSWLTFSPSQGQANVCGTGPGKIARLQVLTRSECADFEFKLQAFTEMYWNISVLLSECNIINECNAGISGQPEGATPGHPGAFVTAAVTNTC